MKQELEYLNDFHKENSLALQESVKQVAKKPLSLTQFLEQVAKVQPANKPRRVR